MKRRLISAGMAALAAASLASAQSNGERFDAATVLTPGMVLERHGMVYAGGYQAGTLQHGDVITTESSWGGNYNIVTTDGSVIGIRPGTKIAIDGRRIGFEVFQVVWGSADVLGNVRNGYPMPLELLYRLPRRFGNLIVYPAPNPGVWQFPVAWSSAMVQIPLWNL